jgi:hypothetical protein
MQQIPNTLQTATRVGGVGVALRQDGILLLHDCDVCAFETRQTTGVDPAPLSPSAFSWRGRQLTRFTPNIIT